MRLCGEEFQIAHVNDMKDQTADRLQYPSPNKLSQTVPHAMSCTHADYSLKKLCWTSLRAIVSLFERVSSQLSWSTASKDF